MSDVFSAAERLKEFLLTDMQVDRFGKPVDDVFRLREVQLQWKVNLT
jgi:hypothetical protein